MTGRAAKVRGDAGDLRIDLAWRRFLWMLLCQRHYALVLRLDRRDRLNISLAVPPDS
jgi:hypothetical protein